MINIFALRLSGEWGWVAHVADMQDGDKRKIHARNIGGHILERFNLKRAGYDAEQWRRCKKDILGRPMPDNSDQDAKVRRRFRDKIFGEAVREGVLDLSIKDVVGPHGETTRHIAVKENRPDGQE